MHLLSQIDILRILPYELFDLLARTAARMLQAGRRETGLDHALICGGVSSSELFRKLLGERLSRNGTQVAAWFGDPDLSGDNAVGVAMIGADRYRREYGT